jgi:hypothetical protein
MQTSLFGSRRSCSPRTFPQHTHRNKWSATESHSKARTSWCSRSRRTARAIRSWYPSPTTHLTGGLRLLRGRFIAANTSVFIRFHARFGSVCDTCV